ncbi:MAG TPA: DUF1579 family protein [Gammaproteobacteria bacterium]
MKRSAATPELEPLNAFVGIWDTVGEVKSDPAGSAVKFKATDTYEWLPGGYFLLHRYDADMPDGKVIGIEVIGYSAQNQAYAMYAFDSLGNASEMLGQFEMENWTFVGETTLFTGGFSDVGKVFTGLWERRAGEGHDWQPWMEVKLNKVE